MDIEGIEVDIVVDMVVNDIVGKGGDIESAGVDIAEVEIVVAVETLDALMLKPSDFPQ